MVQFDWSSSAGAGLTLMDAWTPHPPHGGQAGQHQHQHQHPLPPHLFAGAEHAREEEAKEALAPWVSNSDGSAGAGAGGGEVDEHEDVYELPTKHAHARWQSQFSHRPSSSSASSSGVPASYQPAVAMEVFGNGAQRYSSRNTEFIMHPSPGTGGSRGVGTDSAAAAERLGFFAGQPYFGPPPLPGQNGRVLPTPSAPNAHIRYVHAQVQRGPHQHPSHQSQHAPPAPVPPFVRATSVTKPRRISVSDGAPENHAPLPSQQPSFLHPSFPPAYAGLDASSSSSALDGQHQHAPSSSASGSSGAHEYFFVAAAAAAAQEAELMQAQAQQEQDQQEELPQQQEDSYSDDEDVDEGLGLTGGGAAPRAIPVLPQARAR